MRLRSSLFIVSAVALVFVLVMAFVPSPVSSSTLSGRTIDQYLREAGLPANAQVIKVNLNSPVALDEPIVILGSGIDAMENQVYQSVSANFKVNSSYVLSDRTSTFGGKSIESYDMVVVGGPEHNAYAKSLLGRGILRYNVTGLKTPGIVVEAEKLPTGRTVLIVASVAGYPYQDQSSPDALNIGNLLEEVLASPTAQASPAPTAAAGPTTTGAITALFGQIMGQHQITMNIFNQQPGVLPGQMSKEDFEKYKPLLDFSLERMRQQNTLLKKLMDESMLENGPEMSVPSGGGDDENELVQQQTVFNEMMTLTTNMLKTENDMRMTVIRNLRD